MNPFVQKALSSVHAYPSSSATLSTTTSEPTSLTWALKRDAKTGGLLVDSKFRVQIGSVPKQSSGSSPGPSSTPAEATMNDVFALGDVSVFSPGRLPATAQVANQQSKWLGKHLNAGDLSTKDFTFKNLGVMTYLGNMKAIMQTGGEREVKGYMAWLIWRGAYLTQTISLRNKLLIPIYW